MQDKKNNFDNTGLSVDEKAERIFDAIDKFIKNHPEETMAPNIVITQEWKVECNYGGWYSDSDYVNTVTSIMGQDDEGYYYDVDFIKTKIPEIQKSLDEAAKWCEEEYGEVPRHDDLIFNHVTDYYSIISQLIEEAVEKNELDGWILEIDLPIQDAYLVKREMRSPSYGGLIRHHEISEFLMETSEGKKVNLSKVQELADSLVNDDWDSSEYDPDDKGGELFQSLMP